MSSDNAQRPAILSEVDQYEVNCKSEQLWEIQVSLDEIWKQITEWRESGAPSSERVLMHKWYRDFKYLEDTVKRELVELYRAKQQAAEDKLWQEDLSQFLNVPSKPSSVVLPKPSLDVLPKPPLSPISKPSLILISEPTLIPKPLVLAVTIAVISRNIAAIDLFSAFDDLPDQTSLSEPTPPTPSSELIVAFSPISSSADFVAATEEEIEDLDSSAGAKIIIAPICEAMETRKSPTNLPSSNLVKAYAVKNIISLPEDAATNDEVICGDQCRIFDPGIKDGQLGSTMVLRSSTRRLALQSAPNRK